jgi:hypothetical protein
MEELTEASNMGGEEGEKGREEDVSNQHQPQDIQASKTP